MNVFLYSLGGSQGTRELDAKIGEIVGKKGTITYIPSCLGPNSQGYFADMQSWYKPFGVSNFNFFFQSMLNLLQAILTGH